MMVGTTKVCVAPADDDPPRYEGVRAGGGRDLSELRPVEEDHRPGIFEHVADLARAQPEVHRDRGGTQRGRGKRELDRGEVVKVEHGQPVAVAYPGVAQRAGQPQEFHATGEADRRAGNSPIAAHPPSMARSPRCQALKAKADAFVKSAVKAITSSRAWTGSSVIFIAADESDYDGSDASDSSQVHPLWPLIARS